MKHAVSVSIGSARRDKMVEISLLGKDIRLERIGTDGDLKCAQQLYEKNEYQPSDTGALACTQ